MATFGLTGPQNRCQLVGQTVNNSVEIAVNQFIGQGTIGAEEKQP
jgi:hypothetical protein